MGHILLPMGRAMAAAMQRSRVAEISRTSVNVCVSSEDMSTARQWFRWFALRKAAQMFNGRPLPDNRLVGGRLVLLVAVAVAVGFECTRFGS